MKSQNKPFLPGQILHEVIVGCLRAKGLNFGEWCQANEIHVSTARNATYGQSSGPRGQAILDRLIEAADPDLVAAAYKSRMRQEADRATALAS